MGLDPSWERGLCLGGCSWGGVSSLGGFLESEKRVEVDREKRVPPQQENAEQQRFVRGYEDKYET